MEPFHGIIALNNAVINFELVDGGRIVESTIIQRPNSLYITFHHMGYNFYTEVFSERSDLQTLVQFQLNLNISAPSA